MTAKEYGQKHGHSRVRVYQLIAQGRLEHQVVDGHVIIDENVLWPLPRISGRKKIITKKEVL